VAGRVVLVGLAPGSLTLSALSLVLGRKSLLGSLGSPHGDVLAHVLQLIAAGDLQPPIEVVPFDTLNEAYGRLRAGAVSGRLVTHPNA
jgi:propanol-preferring alcohol dehydrogenase